MAVSGLEMAQNSARLSWSKEEVDDKLKSIMKSIFNSSKEVRHKNFSWSTIAWLQCVAKQVEPEQAAQGQIPEQMQLQHYWTILLACRNNQYLFRVLERGLKLHLSLELC